MNSVCGCVHAACYSCKLCTWSTLQQALPLLTEQLLLRLFLILSQKHSPVQLPLWAVLIISQNHFPISLSNCLSGSIEAECCLSCWFSPVLFSHKHPQISVCRPSLLIHRFLCHWTAPMCLRLVVRLYMLFSSQQQDCAKCQKFSQCSVACIADVVAAVLLHTRWFTFCGGCAFSPCY